MAQYFIHRHLALVMGAGLLFTACSQANASQSLAILDTETSTRPVPEVVTALPDVVGDSVRFLGDHNDRTYFVARHAENPDHLVCLIQLDPATDHAGAACSDTQNMTNDKIATLEYGSAAVALVADDPSTTYLQEDDWQQAAENLWIKGSTTL